MEAALMLWECVIDVRSDAGDGFSHAHSDTERLHFIYCMPPNIEASNQRAQSFSFEDKEAVIEMIIKGNSTTIDHIVLVWIGHVEGGIP